MSKTITEDEKVEEMEKEIDRLKAEEKKISKPVGSLFTEGELDYMNE